MYRPSFCTFVTFETDYQKAKHAQERQRLIALWSIRIIFFTLAFSLGWLVRGVAS